jgi:hypothetical protein
MIISKWRVWAGEKGKAEVRVERHKDWPWVGSPLPMVTRLQRFERSGSFGWGLSAPDRWWDGIGQMSDSWDVTWKQTGEGEISRCL